jgi:hypothetical protein
MKFLVAPSYQRAADTNPISDIISFGFEKLKSRAGAQNLERYGDLRAIQR